MHKIQSTYSYSNAVFVQVPMDSFFAIGPNTNKSATFFPLFKSDKPIPKNNFSLDFFDTNITRQQYAANKTAVQLTKNATAQKKNQFNDSLNTKRQLINQ